MRPNTATGFRYTPTQTQSRPRTSVSKRTIDVYNQVIPLHRRIRQAYQMGTQSNLCPSTDEPMVSPKIKVDSEQPEAVYNWLDEF